MKEEPQLGKRISTKQLNEFSVALSDLNKVKGQRLGQCFCNYFNIHDSDLFYENDLNKCWTIIYSYVNVD